MLHLTDGDLADLLDTSFAVEQLCGVGDEAAVVTVQPGGRAPGADHVERLASLPCILVGVDRPAGDAVPWADLVCDPVVAPLDAVVRVVDANPVAATSLALLLRSGHARAVGQGLVAESAVDSMLQAGPEFQRWRAARPRRQRPPASGPAVRVERDGDRLDLVLDRPQVRNALDRTLRDDLLAGLAVAGADPSVREVVLRGDGPSFCSGGDLDEFGSFTDPPSAHVVRLVASIGRAIDQLGDRVRAEVHGPCAGSGVELPAFAPQVVAAPTFTACLPEVTLGLIPGAGGTVSITRRVGRHRCASLALSGATIDAATALAWGLVDEIREAER